MVAKDQAIPVGNGHQTKTQWIKILNANFAYASTRKKRRQTKSKKKKKKSLLDDD